MVLNTFMLCQKYYVELFLKLNMICVLELAKTFQGQRNLSSVKLAPVSFQVWTKSLRQFKSTRGTALTDTIAWSLYTINILKSAHGRKKKTLLFTVYFKVLLVTSSVVSLTNFILLDKMNEAAVIVLYIIHI